MGAFWRPLWILRASLGVLWGSFGGPLIDFLGSLEVLLAAVGCLRGPLGLPGVPGSFWGVSGAISRIFREISGGLLVPCWAHVSCLFGYFSFFFCLIDL